MTATEDIARDVRRDPTVSIECRLAEFGTMLTVLLSGDLAAAHVAELERLLASALQRRPQVLVADLHGVTGLGVESLDAMVRVARVAYSQGCSFAVSRGPDALTPLMTKMGLAAFPSVSAAMDELLFDSAWRS